MRRISLLFCVLLLSACGDWPTIDAPPLAEDESVGYTSFSQADAFETPTIEIDPDAPDAEELVTARAEALRARAARLRAQEL